MDQFMDFVMERWIIILVAIAAIFIVIKLVKSLIKWAIIIAIVAAIIIYGSSYVSSI